MKLHALNRQRLRYQHHIRIWLYMLLGLIVCSLAIYGAYMAATGFFSQEARIAEAEAATQQALDYLNGKKVEIEKAGDTYGYRYKVVKELVQLKEI